MKILSKNKLLTISGALLLLTGCATQQSALVPSPSPIPPASTQGPSTTSQFQKSKLTLQTFQLSTPTPMPTATPTITATAPPVTVTSVCADHTFTPQPDTCDCPYLSTPGDGTYYCGPGFSCTSPNGYAQSVLCDSEQLCRGHQLQPGKYCWAKPVIYLYPQKDTEVSVSLQIPGTITDSIPTYPIGGWQNILAHPSGIFDYQGKSYHELFYESAVNKNEQPESGVVLRTDELSSMLPVLTGQLGLKPSEQQEFVQYWLPKLQTLNRPYILFSVLTPSQKDAVDQVDISPKPNTFINFLVSFKPLETPIAINPLVLPKTPPQRVGFTAVEWGGAIDQ